MLFRSKDLIKYLQILISSDNSAESEFLNNINNWVINKKNFDEINIIPGNYVGTKTNSGEPILVDDLMGQDKIDFSPNIYGIWIPNKELLNRTKYEYVNRMSIEQIMQGNFMLAKYLSYVAINLNVNTSDLNKINI